MTAPERIWAWRFITPKVLPEIKGGWTDVYDRRETEYILHTRAALAASPLVQEIVAEAVQAALGVTRPIAAQLLHWIDDEMGCWTTPETYADDLAKFAAAIRARGEG